MSLRRSCFLLVALGAAVALTSGCGDLSDGEVTLLAEEFARADAGARCELLAPNTLEALEEQESSPCAEAIGQLEVGSGDVQSVAVWGEEAQVKLSDDTLFLTRTAGGWRISAAACRAQGGDRPYDCRLEAS